MSIARPIASEIVKPIARSIEGADYASDAFEAGVARTTAAGITTLSASDYETDQYYTPAGGHEANTGAHLRTTRSTTRVFAANTFGVHVAGDFAVQEVPYVRGFGIVSQNQSEDETYNEDRVRFTDSARNTIQTAVGAAGNAATHFIDFQLISIVPSTEQVALYLARFGGPAFALTKLSSNGNLTVYHAHDGPFGFSTVVPAASLTTARYRVAVGYDGDNNILRHSLDGGAATTVNSANISTAADYNNLYVGSHWLDGNKSEVIVHRHSVFEGLMSAAQIATLSGTGWPA